jgi:glycosyltransferase involved in cell wall biosynthesis
MKILFVHEVSYSKKVIFEMHEFPELLSLRGHEITFLEFDEGRKFWDGKSKANQTSMPGRVHPTAHIKIARPFQFGIPGLDRLAAVITFGSKLKSVLRSGAFDVVVLYAVPTFGPQTIRLARKARIPVVFRALDASHKIRGSLVAPLIKMTEKFVYKNANLLSANNQAMANYCQELSGRTGLTQIHYPPLDLEHFRSPKKDAALSKSLGLAESDKVITYMGSFFYFSGLKAAIEEFAKSAGPQHKLLLIGGGELDRELRELAQRLGVKDQVIFTGLVPYAELPKYLGLADVAVNTLEPTLVANVALPNKVLQYVASGLRVVSTNLPGLKSVFGDSSLVEWGDSPEEVMKKAIALSEKPLETARHQISPDEILVEFEPTRAVGAFEDSLLKLVAGGKK